MCCTKLTGGITGGRGGVGGDARGIFTGGVISGLRGVIIRCEVYIDGDTIGIT